MSCAATIQEPELGHPYPSESTLVQDPGLLSDAARTVAFGRALPLPRLNPDLAAGTSLRLIHTRNLASSMGCTHPRVAELRVGRRNYCGG